MREALEKLRLKEAAIVINCPAEFAGIFTGMNFPMCFDSNKKSSTVLVFVRNKSRFIDFLRNGLKQMEYDGHLWIIYPKGTSGVTTDVNREVLWHTAEPYGIRPVTSVSIDNVWSALRFRPIEMVKSKSKA